MQSYKNSELLILDDGDQEGPERILEEPNVRYLRFSGRFTVGHKRNMLCQQARGDVIAHFDDDDYSAPGRLQDQIQRLMESGMPVTGYGSMRFTNGKDWWEYRGPSNYALGTSLVYLRSWWAANPFKSAQVGEDNDFVMHAKHQRKIVSVPAGDLMWATIHNTNTSPRQLVGNNWRKL